MRSFECAFDDCASGSNEPIPWNSLVTTHGASGAPRTWIVVRAQNSDLERLASSLTLTEPREWAGEIANRYGGALKNPRDKLVVVMVDRSPRHSSEAEFLSMMQALASAVGERPQLKLYYLSLSDYLSNNIENQRNAIQQDIQNVPTIRVDVLIPKLLNSTQAAQSGLRIQYEGCMPAELEIPNHHDGGNSISSTPLRLVILPYILPTLLVGMLGLAISLVFYRWNILNMRHNLHEFLRFPWVQE